MVMGVPESGVPAAEGFARASGIPYGQGLVKNRYIGRSFIAPGPAGAGRRRAPQAQPADRRHRGQAAGGGGRLHRARHDAAFGDPHAARGRRGRGAPAHLLAAVALALLLRHRHARRTRSCWRPTTASRRWPEILGADSLAYISIENLKAGHRRRRRASATPASPATTRPRCPSRRPRSRSAGPTGGATAYQAALPGV